MVQSKFMPEIDIPIDEQFMLNFKEKGGKFLYCDSIEEAFEIFNNILQENDWYETDVCCFEPGVTNLFSTFNLRYTKNTKASFYFATCEYLIGNIGAILLSSSQLKEKKMNELPDHMVVISYTSQLVKDISEGLKGIKNRKGKDIPTNITTIQSYGAKKENNFMTYGSSAKNLYLLLVEDL